MIHYRTAVVASVRAPVTCCDRDFLSATENRKYVNALRPETFRPYEVFTTCDNDNFLGFYKTPPLVAASAGLYAFVFTALIMQFFHQLSPHFSFALRGVRSSDFAGRTERLCCLARCRLSYHYFIPRRRLYYSSLIYFRRPMWGGGWGTRSSDFWTTELLRFFPQSLVSSRHFPSPPMGIQSWKNFVPNFSPHSLVLLSISGRVMQFLPQGFPCIFPFLSDGDNWTLGFIFRFSVVSLQSAINFQFFQI